MAWIIHRYEKSVTKNRPLKLRQKKATCVHIYINIDHLVSQHEFTPSTNLNAWGTDPTIDDTPTTPATSPPSNMTNALTPEFQKFIVNLAKGSHFQSNNFNSTPTAPASGAETLPPISM